MKNLFFAFALMLSSTAFAQTKATLKLFKAIEKNNLSLAQNAIAEGADANGVDDLKVPATTVLIRAVQLNRLEIVKLLLANHADTNISRPTDFHTALMVSANKDSSEIAEALIAHGADVNIQTPIFFRTALHIAALHNSTGVAQAILKAKDVDVNARPNLCALAVAARQGNLGIVTLLKKQNGPKAANPVCLEKAIHVAEFNKREDVLAVLKRN